MSLKSVQTNHLRRIRFSFFVLLLTSLLATTAPAQVGGIDSDPGDPGTGGKNSIQGFMYYPSGRRLDKRVRVKLSTVGNGDLYTLSDDNGSFTFRRLVGGTYVLSFDPGKEYQAVSERVEIFQSPSRRGNPFGQNVSVQIQLRYAEETKDKAAVVNAALANVPKPALELYQSALASERAGDSKKAIEQLNNAISVYPQFAAALNDLGVQYWRIGQFDKAADALRRALKLSPDSFILRLNYGTVLVYMKQFKEAEPELRHAAEQNEGSAVTHYYLGRTLANLRRLDDAEKELGRAISLGGDDIKEAHRYLGAVYNERGDAERAISELETYLRLVPSAKDGDQIRQIIGRLKSEVQFSQKTKSKGR